MTATRPHISSPDQLDADVITNEKIPDNEISAAKLQDDALSGVDAATDIGVLQERVNTLFSRSPDEAFGFYRPLFLDLTDFASTSGLSIATGGGIIASSAGVSGTGLINLPKEIDRTKAWRMSVLMQFDTNADEGANTAQAILGYGASGVTSPEQRGLNVITDSGGYVNAGLGAIGGMFHGFQPPVGSQLIVTACYDPGANNDMVTFMCHEPDAPYGQVGSRLSNIASVQTWGTTIFRQDKGIETLGWDGIFKTFDRMARIQVTTKSVNHKIMGILISQAGTYTQTDGRIVYPTGKAGGRDTSFRAPAAYLRKNASVDDNQAVWIPKHYDGNASVDLVYMDHPNASDEYTPWRYVDSDQGHAVQHLLNNGYAVALRRGVEGGGASYTAANSSPWGAAAGIAKRKELIDDVTDNWNIRNVYWVGPSMGLIDGLALHMAYPTLFKAIVGFSGVTNLGYAWASEGYNTVINTGYGTTFANTAALAAYDPHQGSNPALFRRVPIKLWHGDADTNIHKANHATAFAALVNAQGGDVTVVNCPGGGHLDSTFFAGVNKADVLSFLQANV